MLSLAHRFAFAAVALALAGCATRPVNPPIDRVDPDSGYRLSTRQAHFKTPETLVILAFSGGGTRAAAFSYGVLEFLRNTEVVLANGAQVRLLDAVGIITGVSGGSFTALACGLYGDKLFADYEQRFLKRDVQGELVARALSPWNWTYLGSTGWGRSELAAELYDEILFNGATFADLHRSDGPYIFATATDISTGARLVFSQDHFDVLCSDLAAVRLSRAAAASSAVPLVLSPVTMNNYGGRCGYQVPPLLKPFAESAHPPRPAARARRELDDTLAFGDGAHRPYLHLVDGGVADNVGMRSVLGLLDVLEIMQRAGVPTRLDRVRRIAVFVVNSVAVPSTRWDETESPPGSIELLVKATGVPIDRYSFEAIELLKDKAARWDMLRRVAQSPAFDASKDAALAADLKGPPIDIFAIDVSFAALRDEDRAEFEYLNNLPTSFVLPPEAVDRLRAAAGRIVMASPEFRRLLDSVGARIVSAPATAAPAPRPQAPKPLTPEGAPR
ncbi:MAG: patatin-like phospholipase family protein [Burkholderiales bacterium]|jgi:NTE family protein|nr:patatin-like phospholipase family protein [Burkholderiales bacterium]